MFFSIQTSERERFSQSSHNSIVARKRYLPIPCKDFAPPQVQALAPPGHRGSGRTSSAGGVA